MSGAQAAITHADVLAEIDQTAGLQLITSQHLCRNVSPAETRASQANRVLAYPLTVGQPLPSLPIWLTPELGLPLDLEAS